MLPVVSVVVPVYNVESYVDECLASILAQSEVSLEVVVVDDGSSDSSATRASRIAIADPRVRVIAQSNQGVSAARNAGLEASSGEFVCFVDSDDVLGADFLEQHLTAALATGADFVISTAAGSASTLQSPTSWTGSRAAAELLAADIPIGCWNKLYRREFLNRAEIRFRRDLYMGEGLYFICECARKANGIVAIGPAGYHYRVDNANSATSVASVDKMRNALYSISEIEKLWHDGGPEVRVALSYQRLWTLFAALVNAVVLGEVASRREFADRIRAVDPTVPMRVHGHLGRRAKALAFRVAPDGMARVASRRGKFARQVSV